GGGRRGLGRGLTAHRRDTPVDAGDDAALALDAAPPDTATPTPAGRPYTYAWGALATHGQEDVLRVPSGATEVVTPAAFRGARFIHDVAVSDDMAVAASFGEEPSELRMGSPDGSASPACAWRAIVASGSARG